MLVSLDVNIDIVLLSREGGERGSDAGVRLGSRFRTFSYSSVTVYCREDEAHLLYTADGGEVDVERNS